MSAMKDLMAGFVDEIMAARNAPMEAACAAAIGLGWRGDECCIVQQYETNTTRLRVGGVDVFEVGEVWSDATCTITQRWLAPLLPNPKRFDPVPQ